MSERFTHQQLVATGREIVQNSPQAIIDVDVEADGKVARGSLLSVGAVSPWGETFYTELKPRFDFWMPGNREFCEAHGLERERLLDEGQDPDAAMRDFATWTREVIGDHGKSKHAVLAAFADAFDFPLVDYEMHNARVDNPYGTIAAYCLKSRAMWLRPERAYDWRDTAKGRLPEEIVPPGDFTHHALEDAVYQQQIHFALVGRVALMGEAA